MGRLSVCKSRCKLCMLGQVFIDVEGRQTIYFSIKIDDVLICGCRHHPYTVKVVMLRHEGACTNDLPRWIDMSQKAIIRMSFVDYHMVINIMRGSWMRCDGARCRNIHIASVATRWQTNALLFVEAFWHCIDRHL